MNEDITILTNGGHYFNINKPYRYHYPIEEIATALSKLCRFGGHTKEFYSVAQHSVLVSLCVDDEFAMEALLHDASEAYLGDVVRPLKQVLGGYRDIEEQVQNGINMAHLGWAKPNSPQVKNADMVLLATERRDLMTEQEVSWAVLADVNPLPGKIIAHQPDVAETMFMARYLEILND